MEIRSSLDNSLTVLGLQAGFFKSHKISICSSCLFFSNSSWGFHEPLEIYGDIKRSFLVCLSLLSNSSPILFLLSNSSNINIFPSPFPISLSQPLFPPVC